MKLTGKAKEDFEKWWEMKPREYRLIKYKASQDSIDFSWGVNDFFDLPFSMQFGVLVDFFDSVGIYIEDKIDTDWDYERVVFYTDIDANRQIYTSQADEHETRNEARTKVGLDESPKDGDVFNKDSNAQENTKSFSPELAITLKEAGYTVEDIKSLLEE